MDTDTPPSGEHAAAAQRHYAELCERHYSERVAIIARRLRDLADDVERQGNKTTNMVSAPAFSWAAHNVVHVLTWGIANFDLSGLVLAAAEADTANGAVS